MVGFPALQLPLRLWHWLYISNSVEMSIRQVHQLQNAISFDTTLIIG